MTLRLLLNAIFQIILFTFIPFLWWFFTARKKEKFQTWIGLIKPSFSATPSAFIIVFLTIGIMFLLGNVLTGSFEDHSIFADYQFMGLGFSGIVPIVIYAFFQTGLSEEILFRGFLGKRLFHKFGFEIGNIIQAILFGIVHGLLLFGNVRISQVAFVVAFISAVAWLMGYVNEKMGNGSIVPSWIIHGLSNMIPAFLILF